MQSTPNPAFMGGGEIWGHQHPRESSACHILVLLVRFSCL